MRNAMPLRWIEQAEARQVIRTALFERAPKPPWSSLAGDAASQWLPRLGSWLAARHPMGMPVAQMQPALVRRPVGRSERYRGDDEGYSCHW
jgi:hypothetical protein